MTDKLYQLTREDVEIEILATQDIIPVRGNAMASGDDAFDKQVEDEILERLANDDIWAWASVEVRVTWNDWSGSDYLGACSYKSEADFVAAGDYYKDMVDEALRRLNEEIASDPDAIEALKTYIPASKVLIVRGFSMHTNEDEPGRCQDFGVLLRHHDGRLEDRITHTMRCTSRQAANTIGGLNMLAEDVEMNEDDFHRFKEWMTISLELSLHFRLPQEDSGE